MLVNGEKRFIEQGLDGLIDAKGRGRKLQISPEKQTKVIFVVCSKPNNRTTCLLAALHIHEGNIDGKCVEKNNYENFLEFLQGLYLNYRNKQLCIRTAEKILRGREGGG